MTDPVKRAEELLAVGDACIRCGLPEDKILWCTSLHSITVGGLLALRDLIARDKVREAEVKALREERDSLKAMNELLVDEVAVKCKDCNRHDIFSELTSLRGVVEKQRTALEKIADDETDYPRQVAQEALLPKVT